MGKEVAPAARRRGTALEQAILAAAWDELAERGDQEVTMAGVAHRAGTSKPVLYRRWPDRTALLVSAVDERIPELGTPAPTGTLAGDVSAVLAGMLARYRGLARVMDAEGPLARQIRSRAREAGIAQVAQAIETAGARRELNPAQVPDRVRRLPVDLLDHEIALGEPVDPNLVAEIVEDVFLPLLRNLTR